jgi:hypothetical protein
MEPVTCNIPTRLADSRLKRTTRSNCCNYTLLPPDDGQLASPKHVAVYRLNKQDKYYIKLVSLQAYCYGVW